jgi:hypothetical protein
MIERGQDSSFALEPRPPVGVVRQMDWQNLDRDVTPELVSRAR